MNVKRKLVCGTCGADTSTPDNFEIELPDWLKKESPIQEDLNETKTETEDDI